MRLVNHAGVQIASAVVLLALGPLLASCVMKPASKTYTSYLTGSANPIEVQTGRLEVVALDSTDGGPLMRAQVDVVAADVSVRDPHYYRRSGISDRNGTIVFSDVPKLVNVSIVHPRGAFSRDNYVVPQTGTSEFRVYVDTAAARTPAECLGYLLCGPQ